jgi:hypothetical protein
MSFLNFIRIVVFYCLIIAVSSSLGCVSVNIGGKAPQKSHEMKYHAPASSFKEKHSPDVDDSWRHEKNGNTISILSECGDPTDPSLEQIHTGIISEIEKSQVLEKHHIDYNARDAIHSVVDGQVDGVQTRFELVVFKKNNCTYVLTYAAVATSFGDNQRDFADFVKGFQIP